MTLFQFLATETNNTKTGNTQNETSDALQLQGNQYLTENSSITSLKSLTISAWVKPDYSQGSPIFTIISDEKAFVLAINNNIPPLKIATFSVFDGIKWITVQSTGTIPEQWTHLAATFNDTSIGIYVNGNLEGTSPIAGIPTLVDGELTTKTMQNLTSNANITIGASYEKVRQQASSLFSGEISNVNLYGSVLTHDQINQIYNSTKPEDNVAYSH
jgi:Concanavalin A-like lectin/glucanases superfamily